MRLESPHLGGLHQPGQFLSRTDAGGEAEGRQGPLQFRSSGRVQRAANAQRAETDSGRPESDHPVVRLQNQRTVSVTRFFCSLMTPTSFVLMFTQLPGEFRHHLSGRRRSLRGHSRVLLPIDSRSVPHEAVCRHRFGHATGATRFVMLRHTCWHLSRCD